MKTIPLVRANVILPIANFLNQIGSPTERLLRQVRLPVTALHDPEALIPLYSGFDFLERAARSEGLEHLGLLVSQQTQIADLGLFGKLLQQSLTLHDLLHTASILQPMYNSGARVWITQNDDQVRLNHQFLNSADLNNQQAQYYVCSLYLKVIQLVTGPSWQPTTLHFQTSKLQGLEEIEVFSQAQVHFNQPNNAIGFPKSLLRLPLERPLDGHLALVEEDYEFFQSTAPATDFTGSLRQWIRLQLPEGYPDVAFAAALSGMSIRSFQRHLMEAGLSYSRVVDQVRFELATTWLQDPTLPIRDIALTLGYDNQANFTRAFKRWAGVTPSEFRHLAMEKPS